MSILRIKVLSGERPRVSARLLPDGAAQIAKNCKLWSGELRPWRDFSLIENPTKAGPLLTVFPMVAAATYWMHWATDVDLVRGPIANDTTKRTYYTGADLPRVTDNTLVDGGAGTDYPTSSYQLGVPAPTTAPAVTVGGAGSGAAVSRAYVNTLVTGWGEEGPPSPDSSIVAVQSGQTVTVDTFATPPTGDYNFTHRRIYRLTTGLTGASYQFVAEIAIATTSYVDSLTDTQLGEVLPSTDWDPPPTDLKGLIALPNGVLAGFRGNEVWLSEPYHPYAWPLKYRYVVDWPVVGLGNYGTTIVVMTSAYSYLINGVNPNYSAPARLPGLLPCLSKRGIVSTEYGVLYPSSSGMVLAGPSGVPRVITLPIMSTDEWSNFKPSTIHARFYNGVYIAFYSTGIVGGLTQGGGFLLEGIGTEQLSLNELDYYKYGSYLDQDTNTLYVIDYDGTTNSIQQWEGAITRKSYRWKSKIFPHRSQVWSAAKVVSNYGSVLSAAQIAQYQALHDSQVSANTAKIGKGLGALGGKPIGGLAIASSGLVAVTDVPSSEPSSVEFKIYTDGVLRYTRAVSSDKPFRLPKMPHTTETEVEVSGVAPTQEIVVGQNMNELRDS